MDSDKLDQVAAAAGNKVQMLGAATGLFGWLSSSQGSILLGLLFALVGLLVNLYFGWRRDRREQMVAEAELAAAQAERAKYERPTRPTPLDYYQ